MTRLKVGIAAAGVVLVLLGVVAAATMAGGDGSNPAVTVASQTAAETLTPAGPAPAAGTGTQATIPAPPTVQDVQKVLAGVMANMAPPSGASAPLTKEQVEAELREELRRLGITY